MLRQDLKQVAMRVYELEIEHDTTRKYLSQIHPLLSTQKSVLRIYYDMWRHLEDFDDRGRRNNILIWGLPEASREEDLSVT